MQLRTIQHGFERVLAAGTVLSVLGIIVAVSIQAFARWLLPSAPAWTEEVARDSFLFSVAFAGGTAMKEQAFVRVDTIFRLLPARAASILHGIIDLLIAALMTLVAIYSIKFIELGVDQHSPSLGISMAIIHATLLLLSVSITLYALANAVNRFRNPTPTENAA